MRKLYNLTSSPKQYWEWWDNDDGSYTVHWGELGTKGQSKTLKSQFFKSAKRKIVEEPSRHIERGYTEIDRLDILLIEFEVAGHGTSEDIEKRYRLQDRMDETLGRTGLGHCDGGSIGSGSMEVCCFVVDFEIAKKIIEHDLRDTEFSNYSRIYLET